MKDKENSELEYQAGKIRTLNNELFSNNRLSFNNQKMNAFMKEMPQAKKLPLPKEKGKNQAVNVNSEKVLVPNAPETKKSSGKKRKRLSRAFPRPLDKKHKEGALVRDSFSFPEAEYDHLLALKKRLQAEGMDIKKSELVRAGLVLLSSLDDADMKAFLAKVPRVS